MKKISSIVLLIAILISLNSCTSSDVNYMTATGKRPPLFFEVTDMDTMDRFVFDTKRFSFRLPKAKPIDFTLGKGWQGMSYRDGNGIALDSLAGHIDISTNYYPQDVGDYERAISKQDYSYIAKLKKKYHLPFSKKMYYAVYGKEKYKCIVTEGVNLNGDIKEYIASYSCYKFNPNKTKYQSVTISLTYSKPLDPKLAQIFTYEDLKQRAKRTLDSLYIKSWW